MAYIETDWHISVMTCKRKTVCAPHFAIRSSTHPKAAVVVPVFVSSSFPWPTLVATADVNVGPKTGNGFFVKHHVPLAGVKQKKPSVVLCHTAQQATANPVGLAWCVTT